MKKWEYKIYKWPPEEGHGEELVVKKLNEFGDQGWELCGIADSRRPYLFFKRPVAAE